MNKDIRISVSFFHHYKTRRLEKSLGLEAIKSLLQLWSYAAINKPKGVFSDMSREDIALAGEWDGDAEEYISTLVSLGFLEELPEDSLGIHDWEYHNPYAFHAEARVTRAKNAAAVRWFKTTPPPEKRDTKRKVKRFVPPTLEEAEAYMTEKGYYNFTAEGFIAFYESKGWKVGKNPMKNWRSAMVGWNTRGSKQTGGSQGSIPVVNPGSS